jgi:hypothetical protein
LFVRGCPCLNTGVDLAIGHIVPNGNSPAVVPPSLLHDLMFGDAPLLLAYCYM